MNSSEFPYDLTNCAKVTGAWITNNLHPHYIRASGVAFLIGTATCGGFVATYSYVASDAPRYITGNSIQMGMAAIYTIMSLLLMWVNKRENKIRKTGGRNYRLTDGKIPENELGFRHPRFRMTL